MHIEQLIALPGATLHGTLHLPSGQGPFAAVLMSPGFGATKAHFLAAFAEYFCQAGLAVLVYDHRNTGHSGGAPRGEIDPQQQLADMRDVLTWLGEQPQIDAQRLGLWGSSYSGGHVLQLAAWDKRAKAVVAQVPTISGYQSQLRRSHAEAAAARHQAFNDDRRSRLQGKTPQYRCLIDEGETTGLYPGRAAQGFYAQGFKHQAKWENRVTLRSVELAGGYEPGRTIARIAPTPLLMLIAKDDTVTPTDLALSAYQEALEPKAFKLIDGGHFDPYQHAFDAYAKPACDWFLRYL